MTIGELAKAAGVNVQTVRYYERMELLPATHRWPGSGYRDFDDDALSRLRFVRSAKDLGFTLREIKELMEMQFLPGGSCAEVKHLLEIKQQELERRMQEMRRLHRALGKLITACRRRSTKTTCPALWAIAFKARR
jgi:DNA-binding transcriptional MerR regulator